MGVQATDKFLLSRGGANLQTDAADIADFVRQGPQGLGFRRYTSADSTEASPIFLPAGVPTPVPLAANGGDPPSRYQNGYTGSAVSGGEFVSQQVGETFSLRLTMTGKSTVMNNRVIVCMDIGGAIGGIDHDWDDFPASAGVAGPLIFKFTGYALDTFLANGAAFIATADQDAYVWAPQFLHLPLSIPS